MSVRGFALPVVAAGCCVALAGCGMLPGAAAGGGGSDGAGKGKAAEESAGKGASAGAWEDEFPEGITPIIEIDKPGGRAQEAALDEFFALYGDVFTAVYEKDKKPAFLEEGFTADAPPPDVLRKAVAAFVDAGAVPKGDMRFYNGLVGAYSEEVVQVDFCVDQRPFTVVDESGAEVEVGGPHDWEVDVLRPNIAYTSTMFEKDEQGDWRSVSFSISPVKEGDADINECLGDDAGASDAPSPAAS